MKREVWTSLRCCARDQSSYFKKFIALGLGHKTLPLALVLRCSTTVGGEKKFSHNFARKAESETQRWRRVKSGLENILINQRSEAWFFCYCYSSLLFTPQWFEEICCSMGSRCGSGWEDGGEGKSWVNLTFASTQLGNFPFFSFLLPKPLAVLSVCFGEKSKISCRLPPAISQQLSLLGNSTSLLKRGILKSHKSFIAVSNFVNKFFPSLCCRCCCWLSRPRIIAKHPCCLSFRFCLSVRCHAEAQFEVKISGKRETHDRNFPLSCSLSSRSFWSLGVIKLIANFLDEQFRFWGESFWYSRFRYEEMSW